MSVQEEKWLTLVGFSKFFLWISVSIAAFYLKHMHH
jgi:hypothetical protein